MKSGDIILRTYGPISLNLFNTIIGLLYHGSISLVRYDTGKAGTIQTSLQWYTSGVPIMNSS